MENNYFSDNMLTEDYMQDTAQFPGSLASYQYPAESSPSNGLGEWNWKKAWDDFSETLVSGARDLVTTRIDQEQRIRDAETDREVAEISQDTPPVIVDEYRSPRPGDGGLLEWAKENPVPTGIGALLLAKMFGVF